MLTPPRVPRLVATSLPSHRQLTLIFAIVVVLFVALGITAPHATRPTVGTENILPAYAGAVCVIELTTAALLLATFRVQRSVALLVLSLGYLVSGLLVPVWALTFPGVFDALGLQSDLQATAWIAAIRRIGFALAVLGFALCVMDWKAETPRRWIAWSMAAAAVFFTASILLVIGRTGHLPTLMTDARIPAHAWSYVPPLTLVLYAGGIVALLRRSHSTLDIWMSVVLVSLVVEIVLLSYLAEGVRLSVGWWAGRIFGMFAAGIILVVLLSETAGNYFRLAEAAALEIRVRRNRLTAMEALSASIAHEVNQPLASMVTNANAGLRWLSRAAPDIEQAKAALTRIAEDGHRADKIVSGIRTMFLKGAQERSVVDLKCVIEDAVSRCRTERMLGTIEVERDFPQHSVDVVCNATQILQVCINLLENAVNAPRNSHEPPSRVSIRLRQPTPDEVEACFSDDGPGVPADLAERIFEPFFSTKPEGMGMGLMFCRTVIEAHGGRLWHSPNTPKGAAFHFTLPSSMDASDARKEQRDG